MHENIRPTFVDPPAGSLLGDMYTAVDRHKNKAVGVFLAVTVLTGVVTLLMPKTYHSEAKLLVRLGRENSTLDPTVMSSTEAVLTIPQPRENEINSVAEILHSRTLLEKVVDALSPEAILHKAPRPAGQPASLLLRDQAVRTLDKSLTVTPVRRTNVIALGYDANSPEIAQKVVAELVDSYLAEHLRLNRPAGAHEFLAAETGRIRAKLTAAEEQLRDVKNATGLAALDKQRETAVAQAARIENELRRIGAALASSRAKAHSLEESLAQLPETEVVARIAGYSNEGTDAIRAQFYGLQLREQSLGARMTENHPLLQEVRRQVAEARDIAESQEPTRTQVTTSPNRVRHEAELALAAERPLLASLQAEQATLQTQLVEARQRLNSINDHSVQIVALQREIQLLEGNYRRYATNLEQSRIDQSLESQRISNISIAQAASFEPRPLRPHKLWNLLLGMAVGIFGGIGLAVSLDYFPRPRRAPGETWTRAAAPASPAVSVWQRRAATFGPAR